MIMRLKKALAGLLAAVLTVTSASFGVYAETAFGEPGGADNSVSTENELYLVQPEAGYLKAGDLNDVVPEISVYSIRPNAGFKTSYYDQLDEVSQKIYSNLRTVYSEGGHGKEVDLIKMIPEKARRYTGLTGTTNGDQLTLSEDSEGRIMADLHDYIYPALAALQADHPEMSWISHVETNYGYQARNISPEADGTFSLVLSKVPFKLETGYEHGDPEGMEYAVARAKNAINARVSAATAQYYETRVKAIHDYLCETVAYNYNAAENRYDEEQNSYYQTAYSAFYPYGGGGSVSTVCAGYARAFKVLCDSYDIPCVLVEGLAGSSPDSSSKGAHMWNYVKMPDNMWYAVDVTWDDQKEIRDDFFLVGGTTLPQNFAQVSFEDSHITSGDWSNDSAHTFAYPELARNKFDKNGRYPLAWGATDRPAEPTAVPTEKPGVEPTAGPAENPEIRPTMEPGTKPTAGPTEDPAARPTEEPVKRNGWVVENGVEYWYENGVKQGTEGRGKEIYDPVSKAWYWLDSVSGGRKAMNKEVYQESNAGVWAENKVSGTGKWVRYDENGHMVKGWYTNSKGTYYYDTVYGTMAKGNVVIDGTLCYFDPVTGIAADKKWVTINGAEYWYEGGIRQGLEGRGKEIYDSASRAWYWLDSVNGGRKAVSKDVYQESEAGPWAEEADGIGKWVRYDAAGHMVKGWSEQNGQRYYFDPVYGTMAKDVVTIEGAEQVFHVDTGVYQGELENVIGSNAMAVVNLVNSERAKAGLAELRVTMRVQRAAETRAQELITQFSHTRPNGTSCFTALDENGVERRGAGENIAAGYNSPENVVNGWMNSSGHRANILGNFTHIGVGYHYNANTVYGHYWTQLFINR